MRVQTVILMKNWKHVNTHAIGFLLVCCLKHIQDLSKTHHKMMRIFEELYLHRIFTTNFLSNRPHLLLSIKFLYFFISFHERIEYICSSCLWALKFFSGISGLASVIFVTGAVFVSSFSSFTCVFLMVLSYFVYDMVSMVFTSKPTPCSGAVKH